MVTPPWKTSSIVRLCLADLSLSLRRAEGRAYNSEHQYELVQECASRFAEEKTYKLLVSDAPT